MRRWLRFAGRAALVLLIFLCVALATVYGLSKTDRFLALLRDEIVARGSDAIVGEIAIGAVEGSIWNEVVLRSLELRDDGGEVVARIPSVRLRYDLLSLAFGRFRIEAVELERPALFLAQDDDGEWNLLRSVTPLLSATGEPPPAEEAAPLPIAIALESLRIDSLEATLAPAGMEPVGLRNVQIAAAADLAVAGVTAEIEDLRAWVELPGRPPLRVAARIAYEGAAGSATVRIGSVTVETDHSSLELTGTIRGLETPEPDLRLVARPLAATDVNAFVPDLGLRPDVTGDITLAGSMSALRATADLAAGEASLTGAITADTTKAEPPWQAALAVVRLDLSKLLDRGDATGRVEARLDARGRGAAPGAVSGEASIRASGLAYASWRPGDVSLDARVAEHRLTIEGRVKPGHGRATVTGEVDLSGSETFDLRLVTESLAPLRTPGGEPSGDLNLEATLRGRSFSPETLDAELEATVTPSVLGGASLGGARLEATARGGAAEGTFEARRVRAGENRFGGLRVTFQARGLTGPNPAADVNLVVEDLVAGVELRRLEVTAETVAGDRIASTIGVLAVDREERTHRANAKVAIAGETARLELGRLSLDLPGGEWRLAQPTTIERRGDEVTIDRFLMTGNGQTVSLAGLVSATGNQDFALEIDGVLLESFEPLVPHGLGPTGRVSFDARLRGTAAAPLLEARLEARDLHVSAVRAEALDVTLSYAEGEASLRLDLRQDAAHGLEARGEVPVEVAWAPEPTLEPLDATELPLDVRIRSAGLDLSFLDAFGERTFQNVAGTLSIDVAVRGTGARPKPSGTIALREGRVDLTALGVKVHELDGDATISADAVRLERLSARSGKGRIEASGQLALRNFAPEEIDASVTLEGWPAIHTREYQATLRGNLTATGSLDEIDARGRLEVLSATIRPNLAFLTDAPPPRDETIVLVGRGAPKPEEALEEEEGPQVAETINRWESLALDLTVEMKRDVWVKQEGTALELAGDVNLRKRRGGTLQAIGRIHIRRGWARFQTKRFRIEEGEIRLTGGRTIDPLLEIVARHQVRGYTIDVVVGGRVSKPELELRSDPALEQADTLAVLLFGRPTSELTEGEQGTLGHQASSIATTFAVTEVSRKVSEALGIEHLGIQIEEVSIQRTAVGAYVTRRTYVTLSQELSRDEGRKVTVEYEILPPNWSIVTSTGTSGESTGDILWKKRY